MREEILLAFIFAYIANSVLCDQREIVRTLHKGNSHKKRRSPIAQEGKQMIFPMQGADASFMITNHNTLYENDKHRVAGTTFIHNRMMVGPELIAAHMKTKGGNVNYMHKPTDVFLTFRTQRTDNNPMQIGFDGKMNLYTSPLGTINIDGNVGYNRMVGVPSHLANPAWEAGLDVNLINNLFFRGGITLRL